MRRARDGPLLALAILALLACPPPASAQKPRAERPTYSLGEKWIRSDGVYDLIRVEKDVYVFAAQGGREVHLTRDLMPARILRGDRVLWEFDPPPGLRWPLEVGRWSTTSGIWTIAPDAPAPKLRRFTTPQSLAFTSRVEAYEDVQVPAGTLKAFRIAIAITSLAGTHFNINQRLVTWYAPEARQFVRAEGEGMETLAYQVVAVERPEASPLRVVLADPTDQARATAEGLVVTGKVTAGRGVGRVSVTLNGVEVARQEAGRPPQGEMGLRLPVTLREGKNLLVVTAADARGETRQETRTVYYDRPAPPPAPSASAVATPTAPPGAAPAPAAPAPRPALPAGSPGDGKGGGPLQVAVAAPPDQARVEQPAVALAGLASGGKGIRQVTVTLNGVEVSRREEPTPQPSVAVNMPLTLREGQNTLVLTATDAAGAMQQEARTVHYERGVPLAVEVRFPVAGARMEHETTVVVANAASSRGVARVTVSVNGVEAHQQVERRPRKAVAVTAPVVLREGTNAIVIRATEPDGTERQEMRTVIYDKPKTAVSASPPAQTRPAPNRWAVVIGVGQYESEGITRLRYTVPDAEAVYQMLVGPGGLKKEHALLLTDKTERKPTLRNIRWALGTFLSRSARKDDTVLIFFAGHGAPEIDPQGVERDGLAKYLIPSDADPDDLYSTALPMDDIQTIFGRIEAERVIVFLDACYSGAAGGRTFSSKKTRGSHVDDLFLERLTRSKGRAIITASRPAEVSIELPELGHGLFTYYLLQGLRGAADLNRDGIVSLQELYEYVEQQVSQKSRAVGGNQHPVMKGEMEGPLPLVKVGGR